MTFANRFDLDLDPSRMQRTSPLELLAGFLPNLAEMILTWPSLIIIQMVMVCFISRSHRLKIDFRDENFKNLLV